jgi:hypothetical protein
MCCGFQPFTGAAIGRHCFMAAFFTFYTNLSYKETTALPALSVISVLSVIPAQAGMTRLIGNNEVDCHDA